MSIIQSSLAVLVPSSVIRHTCEASFIGLGKFGEVTEIARKTVSRFVVLKRLSFEALSSVNTIFATD